MNRRIITHINQTVFDGTVTVSTLNDLYDGNEDYYHVTDGVVPDVIRTALERLNNRRVRITIEDLGSSSSES